MSLDNPFQRWSTTSLKQLFLHLKRISGALIVLVALSGCSCEELSPCTSPGAPKIAPPPSRASHILGGILMGMRMVGKDSEGVCSPPQLSGGCARSDETQDTLTQIFDHSNYPLLSCTKHYLHTGIKFLLCHPHSLTPHCSRLPIPPSPVMLSPRPGQDSLLPVNGLKAKSFFVCLALIKND